MKQILLGIDFGTGGCKVTLIDTAGHVLASGSGEYATEHPSPGWAQQNPLDWYKTMCEVLQDLQPWNYGEIVGVSLDSYTHGAVLLDDKLQVLCPTIIWTDQRSVDQCKLLEQHGDLIFNTSYQMPTPTWTLPQMMWLSNNRPEIIQQTKHILFVKDYVRYLLTGEMGVDFIEAQGTLFWDMNKQAWSEELCQLAGVPFKALPQIHKPTDIAGKITQKASNQTGLPAGIAVVFGTSDSAVEGYAAGAVSPGQCILKLATAGNVNVMTAKPHPHHETLTYSHVIPEIWYTVTATNSAAICQRWYRDNFCTSEIEKAQVKNINVYDLIDQEAKKSPPGSNGLFFHPYLMGERSPYWNPNLRGSFTGMSMSSSKGDFSRALLEGVAYSLKDCYRTIEKMKLDVDEFILIGGGAKSQIWKQIVCDVFDAPIKCPTSSDASFGSALLAGVGVGVFKDERSAIEQCLKMNSTITPDPQNAEFYRSGFKKYRQIHDALATVQF